MPPKEKLFIPIINRKKGPPIIDVIIPIGTSLGGKIVRAIVSHKIKNIAPTKIDNVKSFLCELPQKYLQICGTIKPIKPIEPVRATKIEIKIVDERIIIVLIFPIFIPTIFAVLSPRSKISNDLDRRIDNIKTIANARNGINNSPHYALPKLPILQNTADLTWFEFLAE